MSSTHHRLSNALSLMYLRALDVHNVTIAHFGGPPTSQVAHILILTFAFGYGDIFAEHKIVKKAYIDQRNRSSTLHPERK